MSTKKRSELSNYIDKERYLELKHFCLQYGTFRKLGDSRAGLIEQAAENTDTILKDYILRAVTHDCSYEVLRTMYNIPCCRNVYYILYRKFFWLLDQLRN